MTSDSDFVENSFAPIAIEGQDKNIPLILKGSFEASRLEVIDETEEKGIKIRDTHSTEEMTIIEITFSPTLSGLHLIKICIDGDCDREQGRLIPVVRDEIQKEKLINFQNIKQNFIIDTEGEVQFLAAS